MDQASYFRSRPPRCIAGFIARPAELPRVTINAPEPINSVFALFCRCGGSHHYVHGYLWTNPDNPPGHPAVFLSPIVLECATCGKTTDLLDTDVHWYDAELGHVTATVRAEGERAVFECSTCGRQPLEAFVQFEYPDDLFDENLPEFAGREQDLFSWFYLLGRCPQCLQLLPVTDFECA